MAKSGKYPWDQETPWQRVRPTVAGVLLTAGAYLMFSMGWDNGQRHFADTVCDAYDNGTDKQNNSEN